MSFDKLAGIYVYCMDYHSGQESRLYRLMSRIRIKLTDKAIKCIRDSLFDIHDDWIDARIVYKRLVRRKAE